MNKIAIIGGGAAGMFCAAQLVKQGQDVTLFEKNRILGRKLSITGKGRCNLTNNCDPDTVIKNITRNGRFMYAALNGLSPHDVMEFFEGLGVPLKTERGRRVFPASDKAGDIRDALQKALGGCKIVHCAVTNLIIRDGALYGLMAGGKDYAFDKVVVCTGGLSYPATGSTGDGYRFARSAGHTVTELLPSLVPLTCAENCEPLMGLSLKNVTLTLYDRETGKKLYEELGEMLFCHFGVSGPMVLSASAHIARGQTGLDKLKNGSYGLKIDLKPALDEGMLDKRLLADFAKYQNRNFSNALSDLLPSKLIPEVVKRCGIPAEQKVNAVTRAQRLALAQVLKNFELTVTGFRPIAEAIVTSGGVSVSEVDPKTMQSKILPGLYFAGEVLDLDAYTGGYNLQIAFSTANTVANSINKE